MIDTPEKFWAILEKLPNGCWVRSSKSNCKTYSTVKWKGVETAAHRVAAFLSGKLKYLYFPRSSSHPDHVLHSCDNKRCCNPDHLTVGTYSDNLTDAYRRKLRPAKLTATQVLEIRSNYSQGETQMTLAKKHGVSQAAISKIVRNEHYKELT